MRMHCLSLVSVRFCLLHSFQFHHSSFFNDKRCVSSILELSHPRNSLAEKSRDTQFSHTLECQEVTYDDYASGNGPYLKGYDKIAMTCHLAAEDDIHYAWVDTCCIRNVT
ncbi:hypothetical protein FB567DRAFT_541433 [Paraphoma chrysanthemicola]|uniref:Heterokaryon incompatibility domain-containing protein n=1 Tax=Paraphoma chrysanthemicola TaxID=798071 RepID=A0A8K0QTA2_9PLEO|nr:hypothetical protein FB567DRAFT_541433 [Paraphoma chrysanthemicola]